MRIVAAIALILFLSSGTQALEPKLQFGAGKLLELLGERFAAGKIVVPSGPAPHV